MKGVIIYLSTPKCCFNIEAILLSTSLRKFNKYTTPLKAEETKKHLLVTHKGFKIF
jgi:hypothetical protein